MNVFDDVSLNWISSSWSTNLADGCLLAADAEGAPFQLPIPVLVAIMFGLFYLIVLRPQQNKDKSFRTMLEGLKEKDRVVTIGGIHGVVTNVQRDRDEVTIRVDEASGAKIRVNSTAIAKLVTDEDKNEKKTN